MASTRDGGRSALLGFLSQVVVALGMKAQVYCSDAPVDSDELDALLTMVHGGELRHEYFDSDLAIMGEGECGLAQFKYSRQVPPPKISPKKLIEIVDGLQRSALSAKDQGLKVSTYALVSNRPLGSKAAAMHEAALRKESHEYLTQAYHYAILEQLLILTGSHLSDWEGALVRFAREFGAEEQEISRGIDTLVTHVIRETVEQGSARIVREDLIEAFTGCRDAHRLVPESVVERSAQCVQRSPARPSAVVVLRNILDEIGKAISTRALVILYGMGGCGKTVALWQWAQQLTLSSRDAGVFTSLRLARQTPACWIAEEISEWGNLAVDSSRRREKHARALERLRLANPGLSPPILHLGLDGLDEEIQSFERRDIVRELIYWFWEEDKKSYQSMLPPKATLVVTCRDPKKLISEWLEPKASGYDFTGEPPKSLQILPFSSEELLLAAGQTGNSNLYERITKALYPTDGEPSKMLAGGYEPLTLGGYSTSTPAADTQVVEALKHPAMWRALLELMQIDPGIQSRVLSREAAAVKELAKVFCLRFYNKLLHRGQCFGLTQAQLLDVLHTVALHCYKENQAHHSFSDWVNPACEAGLKSIEARRLYSEACSGGLLEEDDPAHWRWSHPFVGDYLTEAV